MLCSYVACDDGSIKAADVRQQLLSGAWAEVGRCWQLFTEFLARLPGKLWASAHAAEMHVFCPAISVVALSARAVVPFTPPTRLLPPRPVLRAAQRQMARRRPCASAR